MLPLIFHICKYCYKTTYSIQGRLSFISHFCLLYQSKNQKEVLEMLKTKFFRKYKVMKITGKEDSIKARKRIAIMRIRKQPQLTKYAITHELSHLRFRGIKYDIDLDIVNVVEDYIINQSLPIAIKMKTKKIRSKSLKSYIFTIKDMEIILGFMTQTIRDVFTTLKPEYKKLMIRRTKIAQAVIRIIATTIQIEVLRLVFGGE